MRLTYETPTLLVLGSLTERTSSLKDLGASDVFSESLCYTDDADCQEQQP